MSRTLSYLSIKFLLRDKDGKNVTKVSRSIYLSQTFTEEHLMELLKLTDEMATALASRSEPAE